MSKQWIYFDVDETLVLWEGFEADPDEYPIYTHWGGVTMRGRAHREHVRLLREHKKLGKHTIVVWSAGGCSHAEEMVRQLGIGDCVDYVLAKPDIYYDDLHSEDFMGRREYIQPNSGREVSDD